jgi:hypothetical protein
MSQRSFPHSDSCVQTREAVLVADPGSRPPDTLLHPVIAVSPGRVAATLGVIVALLFAASLAATFLSFTTIPDPLLNHVRETLVRLIWVDGEANLPSWFSSSMLFLCAVFLALVAVAERRVGGSMARWLFLALIFGFLSLDETAQLHELSIAPLREHFGTTGFLYYAWVVPAGICVAVFVTSYLSFLARLPSATRQLFLAAGLIYVGGALGLEAISGNQASLQGEHNFTYHVIITAEELCEMVGLVLFIYALLDYMGRRFTTLSLHVGRG